MKTTNFLLILVVIGLATMSYFSGMNNYGISETNKRLDTITIVPNFIVYQPALAIFSPNIWYTDNGYWHAEIVVGSIDGTRVSDCWYQDSCITPDSIDIIFDRLVHYRKNQILSGELHYSEFQYRNGTIK